MVRMQPFYWWLVIGILLAACGGGPVTSPAVTQTVTGPTATRVAVAQSTPLASGSERVVPTGRMSLPRAAHTATALPNGQVLITGGCTEASCEMAASGAVAELYDPTIGAFARTGRMVTERSGHTATLLQGGEVLIAGGWNRRGMVRSAEVYGPSTGRFTAVGALQTGRGGHTATALPDGRVLITGGSDGSRSLASAEVYDPRTSTFSPTGSMTTLRGGHAAARLEDGRVLITGGSRGRGEVLSGAEVYDPVSNAFTRTGDMTVVRHKHATVTLRSGRALILGGSDARDSRGRYASAEVYDPATGKFAPVAVMSAHRFKLPDAVVLLRAGDVLVGGGDESVEAYDPESGRFRVVPGQVGEDWSFATATPLPTGGALITGGYDAAINPTERAWVYHGE